VNCHNLPVADFVDGALAPADESAVEDHLRECANCRELVADLHAIQAATLRLDRREPPSHLLPQIQARLAEGASPGASRMAWPNTRGAWALWLGAAAALILATIVGLLPLLRGAGPGTAPESAVAPGAIPLVDSVEADLRLAEAHYDRAIQGLEQIARGDTEELDPQLAAVLQKNLQVVDQAIDESRAALRTEPGSATAQDGLFDAMRAKVSLLQQTVELINEMRKGNQAEAGRLMQDFSR